MAVKNGMTIRNDIEEAGRFMTEDDERRLGASLRKALISDKPNPSREGCPDPKIIRDLAFHKKIGDAQLFERVTVHMAECSACVRDALGYAEEYKEKKRRLQKTRWILGIAAAAMLAIGIFTIWHAQSQQEMIAKSPAAPIHIPANPVVTNPKTDSSDHEKLPEIASLEPVTIEIPSRWRGAAETERPIIIPRGHLQLEIRLPIGSPEGNYKLRIVDKSGKERSTGAGTAHTINGSTSLKMPLDSSSMAPGAYKLSLLEPGLDEWSDYSVNLK